MRYSRRQRPVPIKPRVKARPCVFLGSVYDTFSWIPHVSRFIEYPAIKTERRSRCRHGIFIQHITLKVFLMPFYPLVLKPILYSAIPILDTHIRTAFGVLETVIDPGSLFANHAIWYQIFYFHCSFICVSMFQVSIVLHFWEDQGALNFVLKIFFLNEQDLVEGVLLLSNSLNFNFSSQRKSRESPHWACRDERYFSLKSYLCIHIQDDCCGATDDLAATYLHLFFLPYFAFWHEHGTLKVFM